MKKQPITTSEERKLKFAEAGILFVLVLAITVFVGVRLSGQGNDEIAATTDTAPAAVVATPAGTPVADDLAEVVTGTPVGDETIPAGAESLTVAPPRPVTYAEAERTYFDGDYAEAAGLFDAYTAEHPDNAWGHYMLGLSAWKAGEREAAAEAFDVALAIKPDHVKSLVNSARVLIELERPAEARTRIETALQLAPGNVDANRVSSRLAHNDGRLDDAVDGYRQVLQFQPEDVWSLNNLGLIRIEQGRFADALAPLAKAAQLQPQMACVQNNLGVALERTGHFGAAAAAYTAALAADGNYVKADESLDRVAQLTESDDVEPIDLLALAASFGRDPLAGSPVAEAAAPTADMDVATALGAIGDDEAPRTEAP